MHQETKNLLDYFVDCGNKDIFPNPDTVNRMVHKGADLNYFNSVFLEHACLFKSVELLKFLINLGSGKEFNKGTLLTAAIDSESEKVTKFIINFVLENNKESEQDVKIDEAWIRSLFFNSIKNGFGVETLISLEAVFGKTISNLQPKSKILRVFFKIACFYRNKEVITYLLEKHKDINYQKYMNEIPTDIQIFLFVFETSKN